MEPIARRLSQQRTAAKIVGTVGLILLVQGLARQVRHRTPSGSRSSCRRVSSTSGSLGVNISYAQLYVTLVGLVAAILLYLLFRFARTGLAMRAVVDDPDLVAMQARSPRRIRRISWVIGCTFAAVSGILVLPFIGLNAIALTFLVVQAFGAAALGGFSSIPLTFVGGLVIGVLANLTQKWSIGHDAISGLPNSIPVPRAVPDPAHPAATQTRAAGGG